MNDRERVEKLEKNVKELILRQEMIAHKLDTLINLFKRDFSETMSCPKCGSPMNTVLGSFPQLQSSWNCQICEIHVLPS
jgi:hypothetical protein